ncbi:hypothetical protein TTHERM_01388180 (macronuclear) [Tetrahymena thermophila SB210]|uniref:Uncharacterized protein n=1 Tax=Tetrahymena thermophila (strain SB210) TaxID=312017 RepID=Q229L6_TETTS|nr:hypothetical protein TTHERM_01388180 [Tetrahymena thermophila SB210]EAR81985.1 hypothetical protein TTHERM_01388180 [Tetrahymena thermophila SB210]|eukprot:XP_001029648.1 hypothetical protein TTHERM_01388180 [Tetrahymena thermophila SB210]
MLFEIKPQQVEVNIKESNFQLSLSNTTEAKKCYRVGQMNENIQIEAVLLSLNLEDRYIYAIQENQVYIYDDYDFEINMVQQQLQKSFLELLLILFHRKVKK